jgi:hypothetical protein
MFIGAYSLARYLLDIRVNKDTELCNEIQLFSSSINIVYYAEFIDLQ